MKVSMRLIVVMMMVVMVAVVIVRIVVMIGDTLHDHVELCRADVGSHDTRHLQFVAVDRQFLKLGFHVLEIKAQIQKRTNGHIATDA